MLPSNGRCANTFCGRPTILVSDLASLAVYSSLVFVLARVSSAVLVKLQGPFLFFSWGGVVGGLPKRMYRYIISLFPLRLFFCWLLDFRAALHAKQQSDGLRHCGEQTNGIRLIFSSSLCLSLPTGNQRPGLLIAEFGRCRSRAGLTLHTVYYYWLQ